MNGEPVKARPISRPARVWRWCRRKPVVASLTAAVFLLLLTLSIAGPLVALQQAENARVQARLGEEANEERKKAVAAHAKAEDERQKAVAAQQQEAKQRTLAEENEKLAIEKAAEAERERKKAEAAKLEEVRQRTLAQENENRARAAREQSLDALSASLYQQAIAVGNSSRPSRRWSALDLLKQAEELRGRERELGPIDTDPPQQQTTVVAELPTRSELRSEAVAALFMQDARLVWDRRWDTQAAPLPSVSPVGHRAAVAWMNTSDPNARGVRLVDLADGSDIQIRENPQMWGTVDLSLDGKMLASASRQSDGVALWDIDNGKLGRTLDWPLEAERFANVMGITLGPNGRFLAATGSVRYSAGSPSQTDVVVWNLETGSARTASAINTGPLMRVAFSADGTQLAYRSDRKKISLWNLESDQKPIEMELPLLIGGFQVVFSPNDDVVAIVCVPDDKYATAVILLWDPVKNAESSRIEMKVGAGVGALAFSPDGSLLAGSDEKGSIYFFDLATRNETFRLQLAHQGIVNFLWWDVDGRHLLSSSIEGTLKYWELPGESLTSTFKTKSSGGYFAINPNGKPLAVMDSRREPGVRLINRETGQVERTWDGADGSTLTAIRSPPELLLFRHDGRQLAQAGKRLAVVWDVETGDEVARWEPDPEVRDELSSAAFTADGQFLVSGKTGKSGKTAVVWNVATGQQVWQAPRDYLQARLSPDGRWVAVTPRFLAGGSVVNRLAGIPAEKPVSIWELATGRELNDLQGLDGEDSSNVVFPLFSPDGHWLVALGGLTNSRFPEMTMEHLGFAIGAANSRVALWHVPSGERRPDMRGPDAPTAYAFSPDSATLAIGYRDGSAELWDVVNHEMVFRWKEHSAAIAQLVFSPDGTQIASSSIDSPSIRFLDLTGLRRQLADVGLDW